jgi:hypothetical protein
MWGKARKAEMVSIDAGLRAIAFFGQPCCGEGKPSANRAPLRQMHATLPPTATGPHTTTGQQLLGNIENNQIALADRPSLR